jgi:integrase/recombinase XerD
MSGTTLQTFNDYLHLQKLSPNTIYLYLLYTRTLPTTLNQDTINKFLSHHNNPVARAFLKQYFKHTKLTFEITPLKKRIKDNHTIRYLTKPELDQLISQIHSYKYAVLLMLLYETGLRISEALSLTPLHIDYTTLQIKGIGKGNKKFVKAISENTLEALTGLTEKNLNDNEPIFNMKRKTICEYLRKEGQRILNKIVTPHMIRHTTAMQLKKAGWPLEDIQAFLNHSSITTTSIYAHAESQEQICNKARTTLF